MSDQECAFSDMLFLWQSNPDLLTAEQCAELSSHLDGEPRCARCGEAFDRNREFLELRQETLRQRRGGVDAPPELRLAAAGRRGEASLGASGESFAGKRRLLKIDDLFIDCTHYEVLTDDLEGCVFLSPCPDLKFTHVSISGNLYCLRRAGDLDCEVAGLGRAAMEDFLEERSANPERHQVELVTQERAGG